MRPPRLLFIIKQKQGESLYNNQANRKPGIHNSINSLVTALVQLGVDATLVDVVDRNGIDAVVRKHMPDIVVLECYWVSPGKIQLLKMYHPNVHWIVRNHSEIPFLAEESNAGRWNCEYLKMGVEVTSVSQRTVEDLMPLQENMGISSDLITFLPNVYLGKDCERVAAKALPDSEIHVGCFGAVRPMKNHLQQAMGAISYAARTNRTLFFHINATRIESHGQAPLKNLREMFQRLHNCELVEHAWMEKDEFYALMKSTIHVLLQCSLTESFNIVAADAVLCSVPVIASSEVRWLGKNYHCDPNSASDIRKHITDLFSGGQEYIQTYVDDQFSDLNVYNERASAAWLKRFGQ